MALKDGLLAYWKMDEAGGSSTRVDAHGSGLNFVNASSIGAVVGRVYPLVADFVPNDGCFISDDARLKFGNTDFTIVIVSRMDSKPANDVTLLQKGFNGADVQFSIQHLAGSDRLGLTIFYAAGSGSPVGMSANSFGAPTIGAWFVLLIEHDSVNNFQRMQVNGGTVDSAATGGGTPYPAAGEWDAGFQDGDANSHWDGPIGPIIVWNRVLTSAEKTLIANGSTCITYKSLLQDGEATIWQLPWYENPVIADILAAVTDPIGSPESKKLLLSDLDSRTLTNIAVQTKTVGSGTYTPTAGMKKVLAIGVGGGGGGGGGIGTDSAGGGGGGGATCVRLLSANDIGASKAYVVGANGTGETSAGNQTDGTATTLDAAGALLNAGGGLKGTSGAQGAALGLVAGGVGGTASNGDLNINGQKGGYGIVYDTTSGMGGKGGDTKFGFGGRPSAVNTAGNVGTEYGGGGSGGHASAATNKNGADGADGILYLIEFI